MQWLGIGHSFIKFPRNVQTIEFSKERNADRGSIESRTEDGLEVVIEISFQFALQPENLYKLYRKFGTKYKTVFQNIAIDTLSRETAKYTAYEFFWDRRSIKDNLQKVYN